MDGERQCTTDGFLQEVLLQRSVTKTRA